MARQTKQQIADQLATDEALRVEQQAELARMRKAKRDAKKLAAQPKVAEHVEAVQPDALHADIEDLMAGLVLPSPKRVMVGIILAVAASALVGYGIGMLLAYALAGIMMLTSTAWIAFTLSVIAWVLALYASWNIGGYVGGKVFASVVMPEGLASRSYESLAGACHRGSDKVGTTFDAAKSKVAGFFTRKEVVAAEFSGAHVAS